MATLKDVAKQANVSVGTASRVINKGKGIERISNECIARVEQAAEDLGYRANYHAQSLQAGISKAIGMVSKVPAQGKPENVFVSSMVSGVDVGVLSVGYHFISIGASKNESEIEKGIRFLEERRIDGLIVPGQYCSDETVPVLEKCREPVVLMHYHKETELPVVNVDDELGMILAVEHLVNLGHTSLLWVGPGEHETEQRRRSGFRTAVGEKGIRGTELILDGFSEAGNDVGSQIEFIREEILGAFKPDSGITGAVCFDEVFALGLYPALMEKGKRIPADISVVGFDDVFASTAYPPMTVISHMHSEVGSQAVDLILEMSTDKTSWERMRKHTIDVEPVLIERKSTGPLKAD